MTNRAPEPGESPFAHRQQGIPLVALFLLTAIVAVLLALLAISLQNFSFANDNWFERLLVAIGSAFFVSGIGMVWGLFHYDRLVGVTVGSMTGLVVGVLAAAVLYSSVDDHQELFRIACVGSVVIVLLAAAIRWQSK